MKPILKISLLCLIIAVAFFLRSEYILEDGKYLLGADPYYHYRMAETILHEGKRPEWDSLGSWPTGQPVNHPPLFHYYLAYTYKIVGISGLDLFHWCMYANVIPLGFCIVFMFLIGKFLTNDCGGLFAASLFATMPAITMRTIIGFTDTDTFILFFSLLSLLFFILAVRLENSPERGFLEKIPQKLYAFLCGFSLFLFFLTWSGYWYMLLLISAAFAVYVLEKREPHALEKFAAFIVGFAAFFALSESLYLEGILFLVVFLVYEGALSRTQMPSWAHIAPAAFVTTLFVWVIYSLKVLQPIFRLLPLAVTPEIDVLTSSYTQMVLDNYVMTPALAWERLGPALFLTPLAVVFLFKRKDYWLSALLIFYISGTALMLLRGGRFSMLMAIPMCLGAALFLSELSDYLTRKKKSTAIASFVLLLVLLIQLIQSGKVNSGPQFMTDDLWDALQWIDGNTPEDSVIMGHWGMGYFIESIGRRHSVMNGVHYNLFWRQVKFSTLLITDKEEAAAREVYGFDSESEVKELRTFSENPSLAEKQIREEMSALAEKDVYLIVDEYTAILLDWWYQYGTWNYATQNGRHDHYNVAFLTSGRKLGKTTEYKYTSGKDLILVYKSEEGFHSFVPQRGQIAPTYGTIFYQDGKKYYFMREEGAYGVIFLPYSEEEYEGEDPLFKYMSTYIFGIPQRLQDIMLTRLYFLDGDQLTYFELVYEVGTVKVYKIHKNPQESLNEGLVKKVDEFTPVATPA